MAAAAVLVGLCSLAPPGLPAATVPVGPGRAYASPNALWRAVDLDRTLLRPGDVVEIDAGTYTGPAATAVWVTDELTVRAVGGAVVLAADGAEVWGKGIFVSAGDGIAFEGITFVGAAVASGNGAGIRQDGIGMTVRRCTFRGNENGILSNDETPGPDGRYRGRLLVEYCVFEGNGAGDGLTHNLYVGRLARCDFRYNYSVGADVGHGFKSRADTNVIAYNRIADGPAGEGSRLVDLSNGGLALLIGNELLQGPNALNRNLVGYGPEGLLTAEAPHRLYLSHNTLVNRRAAGARFVDVAAGAEAFELVNNLLVGPGDLSPAVPSRAEGNVTVTTIAAAGFVDADADEYGLLAGSPAIDGGVVAGTADTFALAPDREYAHEAFARARAADDAQPDAGAHPLPAPLPVTYGQGLTAVATEAGVYLTWATAVEVACGRFDVERSARPAARADAFAAVASLRCRGRAGEYAVTDAPPAGGTYYYRLRQVDRDGAASVSPAVAVTTPGGSVGGAPPEILLFGRALAHRGSEPCTITVVDLGGRPLIRSTVFPGATLPLGALPAGVYLVAATVDGGRREVRRIVLP